MNGQELTIKVIFKTKHSPGTEEHLKQVLAAYLKARGIELKDLTIEI